MKNLFKSLSGVSGLFLTVFGSVFLIIGYNEFDISYELRNNGIKAEGIVKNRYRSTTTDHDVTVYEVLFKTREGRTYEVENHFGTQDDLYQIGDSLEVIYLPNDPMVSRFNTTRELYRTYETTAVIGFVFATVGLFLVLNYKKVDNML
jgi:hypothetical protein